jgi:alkanesulfonate monooxygenase SsuD/methylene tetrahydromethanopterin reductase-like flavin-dependent oxidoreductase (luciferase family)
MGAGNVELEAVAHGLPWASAGTRLDWLAESLTLIRRVLAGEQVTHDGPIYHFDRVRQNPLPIQQPLPVIIGAEGEKKGLRLAAKHADIWQSFYGIDDIAGWRRKDEIFRQHVSELDRDETEIERMIGCKLLIRSTEAAARRAAEEFIAIHKWGEGIWDVFWATTPQRVADALSAFAEAGVQSFTPQIGWPYDVETLEAIVGPVAEQLEAAGVHA